MENPTNQQFYNVSHYIVDILIDVRIFCGMHTLHLGLNVWGPMIDTRGAGGVGVENAGDGTGRYPHGEADSLVKQKTIAPLDRIELPTGARLDWVFARGWKGRRRRIVLSPDQGASYHIMSRTAGGERLFGDLEKEAMRRLMWRMARFSGVEILTYAMMGNHFHILARVPSRDQFVVQFTGEGGEERLFEHLRLLYSRNYIAALRAELADLRKRELSQEAGELVAGYLRRFCNLPLFAKELKERFSRWFNEHRGRRGALWMERFKSVLVEDGEALRTMAAYIDLNPVRAGIVKDPKDYRWCGYGEAMGGGKTARLGLCQVTGHGERGEAAWETPAAANGMSAAEIYRCWLFEDGKTSEVPAAGGLAQDGTSQTQAKGKVKKGGFSKEDAEAAKKRKGKLSRQELLRCRVRYFSDGLVIGSKSFVDGVFAKCRDHFGPSRTSGARVLREDASGSLFAGRQLVVRALG